MFGPICKNIWKEGVFPYNRVLDIFENKMELAVKSAKIYDFQCNIMNISSFCPPSNPPKYYLHPL